MSTIKSLAPLEDFPLLANRTIEGRKITYLDSAATTLKPKAVIAAVTRFYEHSCANIHRGDHTLSREASELFEDTRNAVSRFIGATSREIAFTAGTTDGMNMLAAGIGLDSSHNVIVSSLDHHSNILPWMGRCDVRFLPEDPGGGTDLNALESLIDDKTLLVSLGHASNVTGAISDVRSAAEIAHRHGVLIAVDGAQSVPHMPVDVLDLGCDFLTFSGHKMLGPSGVGVLYVSEDGVKEFITSKLGGGVPDHVRRDSFDLKELPYRLEAGTPNIEGVIGLGAAIDYLEHIGLDKVADHDHRIAVLMQELFGDHEDFYMLGPKDPSKKASIASLVPRRDTVTVGSLGHYLSDARKIMARSGTHCAHPYFDDIKVAGSLRLSTYLYNTSDDIIRASEALAEFSGFSRA